jgi:hypothetical protein
MADLHAGEADFHPSAEQTLASPPAPVYTSVCTNPMPVALDVLLAALAAAIVAR